MTTCLFFLSLAIVLRVSAESGMRMYEHATNGFPALDGSAVVPSASTATNSAPAPCSPGKTETCRMNHPNCSWHMD